MFAERYQQGGPAENFYRLFWLGLGPPADLVGKDFLIKSSLWFNSCVFYKILFFGF